jgi:hypothetical protein
MIPVTLQRCEESAQGGSQLLHEKLLNYPLLPSEGYVQDSSHILSDR